MESKYYADAIRRLTGRMGPGGVSMTAALYHQRDNQYDPNAVGVYVNGLLIGHLQRDEAERYPRVMDALEARRLYGYCRVDIRPEQNPEYIYNVHAYVDEPARQLKLIANHGTPST